MAAYYNENDLKTAAWLRELIKVGLIADGEVDTRSIIDVQASDLAGFVQCHFFAGIGGWSYALRLAGWNDDRHVWTGSCPCQPWSAAGKGAGADDSRDLWPAWFELIHECSPAIVFGEQVAGKPGRAWLDRVYDDMEARGYAVAPVDLPAGGVGAPHIRQRLWFVADAQCAARWSDVESTADDLDEIEARPEDSGWPGECRQLGKLADAECRPAERRRHDMAGAAGSVEGGARQRQRVRVDTWAGREFVPCVDGKSRPVEPGTFPLAHGLPARMGRLRGYGNAIVPQVAQAFIEAYMSTEAVS